MGCACPVAHHLHLCAMRATPTPPSRHGAPLPVSESESLTSGDCGVFQSQTSNDDVINEPQLPGWRQSPAVMTPDVTRLTSGEPQFSASDVSYEAAWESLVDDATQELANAASAATGAGETTMVNEGAGAGTVTETDAAMTSGFAAAPSTTGAVDAAPTEALNLLPPLSLIDMIKLEEASKTRDTEAQELPQQQPQVQQQPQQPTTPPKLNKTEELLAQKGKGAAQQSLKFKMLEYEVLFKKE
jgi:hypothetical protein